MTASRTTGSRTSSPSGTFLHDIRVTCDSPLQNVLNTSESVAKALEKLVGPRLIDLVFHKPTGLVHRKFCTSLEQSCSGELISIILIPEKITFGKRFSQPSRVHCQDEAGNLCDIVFFKVMRNHLLRVFPIGTKCFVSGVLKTFRGIRQIAHPEHVGSPEDKKGWVGLEPLYPLTQKVTNRFLRKVIQKALHSLPSFPEWGNPETLQAYCWPSFKDALYRIHSPQSKENLSGQTLAHQRLAYDEFLAQQVSFLLNRQQRNKNKDLIFKPDKDLLNKFLNLLPFQLTHDQKKVLQEIYSDLAGPFSMHRLVQGDVGSGKTVLAFCASLPVLSHGGQVAFLTPTEILARQHFKTLQQWGKSLNFNTALVVGRLTASQKRTLKKEMGTGFVSILVGTHALLEDNIFFKKLGLVVIDEQHRFGVTQRLQLTQKGTSTNMLAMSATPIPRTLMLAAYGELDLSTLYEKPFGRYPTETRLISCQRLNEVIQGLKRALLQGQKIYWICPLVEESEVLDLSAAQERFEHLRKIFGHDMVKLLHGRMKTSEKEKAMEDFATGNIKLLVATTVVEVGVDIKDATIMVIEHAERFGLAQLHQLRGRIGRENKRSTCLLLFSETLTPLGRKRLKVLRESNDGFYIAEADLQIRGGGDLLGLRQSGLPNFRWGQFPEHRALFEQARKDAQLLLQENPTFASAQGQALHTLLHLFDYVNAGQTLMAG